MDGIDGPTIHGSAEELDVHHRNLVLEHIATHPLAAQGQQQRVVVR
jgi:hypothetical protein